MKNQLKLPLGFVFLWCLLLIFILLVIIIIRGDFTNKTLKDYRQAISKLPIFSQLIISREKTRYLGKAMELSFYQPSLSDMFEFLKQPNFNQSQMLEEYAKYYEKVKDYFPNISEAHAMLGLCYYYSGKKDEAVMAYKSAHQLNPQSFWFLYNLGIISFNDGEYDLAFNYMKTALTKDAQDNLKLVINSRVYAQIILSNKPQVEFSFGQSLQEGYKMARDIALLSYQLHNDQLRKVQNTLSLKNF